MLLTFFNFQVTDGSRGPIAYKGNQWVGYDDKETARQKVN